MDYSPLLGGFAVVLADGRGGFLSAETANFDCPVSGIIFLYINFMTCCTLSKLNGSWLACIHQVVDACRRFLSPREVWELQEAIAKCNSSLSSVIKGTSQVGTSITQWIKTNHKSIIFCNINISKFWFLQTHWKLADMHASGFIVSSVCFH